MFAGPNGSGKTTVFKQLAAKLTPAQVGYYLNPDEIESEFHRTGQWIPNGLEIPIWAEDVRNWFRESAFAQTSRVAGSADEFRVEGGTLTFPKGQFNSYHASIFADFLRRRLLRAGASFTFETVMSARDKVELLRDAQRLGYRTYLYFVSTEDPVINARRVRLRVRQGGHDVPESKIVERYFRSLDLLRDAIRFTDRAYCYDSSGDEAELCAEITAGLSIGLKSDPTPEWFMAYVWDRF